MAMRSLIGKVTALPRRVANSVFAAVKDKKNLTEYGSVEEPGRLTVSMLRQRREREWEEWQKEKRAIKRNTWLIVVAGYGTIGYFVNSVVRSVAGS